MGQRKTGCFVQLYLLVSSLNGILRMCNEGGNPLSSQQKGMQVVQPEGSQGMEENVSKTEKDHLKMQKKMDILGMNWIIFH